MLHIAPTNYHLSDQQYPFFLNWRIFCRSNKTTPKKRQKLEKWTEKSPDRKSRRTRKKNNRGDSKWESNDNPAIPDMRVTSDVEVSK